MADIAEALTAVNVNCETHVIPRLQHGIDASAAQIGAAFLGKHLS
jgi:hypothetical protein